MSGVTSTSVDEASARAKTHTLPVCPKPHVCKSRILWIIVLRLHFYGCVADDDCDDGDGNDDDDVDDDDDDEDDDDGGDDDDDDADAI